MCVDVCVWMCVQAPCNRCMPSGRAQGPHLVATHTAQHLPAPLLGCARHTTQRDCRHPYPHTEQQLCIPQWPCCPVVGQPPTSFPFGCPPPPHRSVLSTLPPTSALPVSPPASMWSRASVALDSSVDMQMALVMPRTLRMCGVHTPCRQGHAAGSRSRGEHGSDKGTRAGGMSLLQMCRRRQRGSSSCQPTALPIPS